MGNQLQSRSEQSADVANIRPPAGRSLVEKFANAYGVEADKMLRTLTNTAFKQREGVEITNEQMMALLVVADQYNLNPFTKEIYAFPDKNAGIVPIVGIDGWSRIINQHDEFDGMEFITPEEETGIPKWMECVIYRKDRSHPIRVREYFEEVKRGTQPWQSHPRRMLRHKSMIQCSRIAFGFTGIYDQDEGEVVANIQPQPASAGRRPSPQQYVEQTQQTEALEQDNGTDREGLIESLTLAAQKGKDALLHAWAALTVDERALVGVDFGEIKKIAEANNP